MTACIYLVGTDTGVGKTAVACALLQRARTHGTRLVPFKPAQSGDDDPSDVDRLLRAAGLPTTLAHQACPLRFAAPLAPGLADDRAPFVRTPSDTRPATPELDHVGEALDAWIEHHQPDLVLIEGAGGLHVPMPGGTWQPTWIRALADAVVVVGRLGLGTINHTLLTIDALRAIDVSPLGFYLCDPNGRSDPSHRDNASVIAAARGVPHLGTLAHQPTADAFASTDLLTPLLAAVTGATTT